MGTMWRNRPRGGVRTLSALGLLVLTAAAPLAARKATSAQKTGRVEGVVTDRSNGVPVLGADVTLSLSADSAPMARAETDSTGAFALDPVPPGSYTLVIRRMGYQELAYTFDLVEGSDFDVSAALVPQALSLDPIVVAVDRKISPEMRTFEARQATGIGTFITREEIERRRPTRTTDIFRTVPLVRVRPNNATGLSMLTMRNGCQPQMVIDGLPVASGYVSPDLTFRPDDIEAIEVYSAATTPPEYPYTGCGTIVVWTRQPKRMTGPPTPWKLLGGLAALVTLTSIIMR